MLGLMTNDPQVSPLLQLPLNKPDPKREIKTMGWGAEDRVLGSPKLMAHTKLNQICVT